MLYKRTSTNTLLFRFALTVCAIVLCGTLLFSGEDDEAPRIELWNSANISGSVWSYSPLPQDLVTGEPGVVLIGDSLLVTGSGFSAGENVLFDLVIQSDDGFATEVVESWSVSADDAGEFSYVFNAIYEEYVDQLLRIDVLGELSSLTASASFRERNTELTLTSTGLFQLCFAGISDSVDLCANLNQRCVDSATTPLAGKEILFFFEIHDTEDGGDCGVGVAQVPDFVVVTDEFGDACLRVPAADVGDFMTIRAKYQGEGKPETCGAIGNNVCDPENPDANKRCVSISGSNDCVTLEGTRSDGDFDDDGLADNVDNCPCKYNPEQEDIDQDGLGDSCWAPTYLRPFTIVVRAWLGDGIDTSSTPFDPELNLRVTDPDGLVIGADSVDNIINTYGPDSAAYYQIDGNDSIVIEYPKTGDYIIEIFPEASALGASGSAVVSTGDGSTFLSRARERDYVVGLRTDGTIEVVFGPESFPTTGTIDTLLYPSTPFAIGDANGDGIINVSDAVFVLDFIFENGNSSTYPGQSDANCDGLINILDVVYVLDYLFQDGPKPSCS